MLTELHVENLGIIDDVTVDVGRGLTTVTGETGAGKTLLVVALGLVTGSRADASVVRSGASEARVEARFVLEPGRPDLGETLDLRDGEIVLTRVVAAEGRSRAYMNGRLVTATQLAETTAGLIVHHGQHTHQELLNPASQRRALDDFAGGDAHEARREVSSALAEARRLTGELESAGTLDQHALAREVDLLRFQVDEIVGAEIESVDELETITAEHELLTGAQATRAALSAAYEMLESTAADAAGRAAAELAGIDPLRALHERASAVQTEIAVLAHDLREAGEAVVEDESRLREIDERRTVLHDLTRKYGATLAEVRDFAATAAARLDAIEHADERAAHLHAEREAATARARDAAERLRTIRTRAAGEMGEQVTERLRELALPSAAFEVVVSPADLGDDGADRVEFLMAPNPGEPPRHVARAASGGELARTMLAVRVTLSFRHGGGPSVFVFDEVDAGIGGDAGAAVGRSLAALASERQVLAVTHLAQVAAHADTQFAVSKSTRGDRTVAAVQLLEGETRVAELSRMLAGDDTSDHARSHAAELLAGAHRSSA